MSWPMKKVSDLCAFAIDCVNKTAPVVDYETKFKMIRTTNIKDGFVHLDSVKYVTEETFLKWTRRSKPQYGDVILTREAPVGQVGRFTSQDQNVFLGQRLFHYRPLPEVLDWNFLAYALMSRDVQGRLQGMGFGATVDHIRVGDAENLEISCPSVQIQRRIGDILSAYDDLIENNRRRIQLLEESARQLYKEWFMRLRFPGHEHVRVVDGVPEGWERRSAWDVVQILSGGTPKTNTADYWNGDIPFFTPKDAVDTAYAFVTEKTLTETGLKNCTSQLFDKNTIFITARGTVGKINLAQTKMAMNQSCYALKTFPPLNQLIGYFALTEEVRQIKAKAVGSVFDAIIKDTFKHIILLVPTCGIIEQFTEYASDILRQIDILSTQNRKLAQARDLLLPKLMSGEVAV